MATNSQRLLHTPNLVYGGVSNNTLEVFISASQPATGTPQAANCLLAPTNATFLFLFRTYLPRQRRLPDIMHNQPSCESPLAQWVARFSLVFPITSAGYVNSVFLRLINIPSAFSDL